MAISNDNLRIGNTIYKLEINNNINQRNKISMVDSEGNMWYRYDKDVWSYKVTPMYMCGSIKQLVRGVVNSLSVSENEYHFSYVQTDWQSGVIEPYYESQLIDEDHNPWTQFFTNEDQAIAAGETICVNRNT